MPLLSTLGGGGNENVSDGAMELKATLGWYSTNKMMLRQL